MGWATSKVSGSGVVTRSGVIQHKGDLGDRLVSLDRWAAREFLKAEAIYCERPAYAPGNSTTTLWSMLGVIQLHARRCRIPFVLKSAGTIKKHVTGSGRASKGDVVKAVQSMTKRSVKDHNEADALALLFLALSEQEQGGTGSPEPVLER